MRYENIIFDLDGTITEPSKGIINAIIYALEKFGIKTDDITSLYRFIGPPLRDSFKDFYGFSSAQTEDAVRFYREYYSDRGLIENEIMPGMCEGLAALRKAGCKLYVATSKPEIYARKILENLNLTDYFSFVAGSTLDGTRDRKEDVIQYLLRQIPMDELNLEKTLMVGDRKFDIEGAKLCNLHHMGVTFGYGSRDELENAGAMYIADSPHIMVDIILED